MLIAAVVVTTASIAALIAAMLLDSGVIAGASAGLCAIGLLVLVADARRSPRVPDERSEVEPAATEEIHHTAGDELFGEHDVQRDLVREERVLNPDMLGLDVPYEEGQRF
jgi:hypothetical protein